jgi:hypothetical protein
VAGRPCGAASTDFLHRLGALPPRVDVWQPRLGPNRLKPWPIDQGVGPVDQTLGPLDLGSGPLGPRVKYTPVVMII